MITGYEHIVQLSVFLKSIGAGFVIGILFSVFSVLNLLNGKNTAIVCIRDIIFFLISAVFTFLFALKYNAGIIRFYLLAGELIGFCLSYMFTCNVIRTLADRLSKKIILLNKKTVTNLGRLIKFLKLKEFINRIKFKIKSVFNEIKNRRTHKPESADKKEIRRKKIRKNIKKIFKNS